MVSLRVQEVCAQAKIDQLDSRQRLGTALSITDQQIVQLQVVVYFPDAVKFLEDLKELTSNKTYCLQAEEILLLEEVVLH